MKRLILTIAAIGIAGTSFAQIVTKEIAKLDGTFNLYRIRGIVTRDGSPLLIDTAYRNDASVTILGLHGSSISEVQSYRYGGAISTNPATAYAAAYKESVEAVNLVDQSTTSYAFTTRKETRRLDLIRVRYISPNGRLVGLQRSIDYNFRNDLSTELCQLVDMQSGTIIYEYTTTANLRHGEYVWKIQEQFSPTGNSYVKTNSTESGTEIQILNTVDNASVVNMFSKDFYASTATFGRDGSTVILAGVRDFLSEHDMQRWRSGTWEGETIGPKRIRVSAIEVWDLKTQKCIQASVDNTEGEKNEAMAEIGRGHYVAFSRNEAVFYDTATKRAINKLPISSEWGEPSLSQDGKYLYASGRIYEVVVTSLENYKF